MNDQPQSHGDTEMNNQPQSHGDTETNSPQRHEATELSTINALTERIIGYAIEVHRILGPGLLEPIYESAMCIEFDDAGIRYVRQRSVPTFYKGHLLGNIAST